MKDMIVTQRVHIVTTPRSGYLRHDPPKYDHKSRHEHTFLHFLKIMYLNVQLIYCSLSNDIFDARASFVHSLLYLRRTFVSTK